MLARLWRSRRDATQAPPESPLIEGGAPHIPTPVRTPPHSVGTYAEPEEAVRIFVTELRQYTDGKEHKFCQIASWYEQRRLERRSDPALEGRPPWPPLTSSVLSKHLIAAGCRRRKVDLRHRGGGRQTMILLPSVEVVALTDKRRAAA
jgi:hypothetical protein